MKILISGANGLVGTALVKKLLQNGHSVNILTRKKSGNKNEFVWSAEKNFIEDDAFEGINSIIHLAGATIAKRWTEKYKKEIYTSRINGVNLLRSYCEKYNIKLDNFISSSGINFYGSCTSDKILTENDGISQSDFLSEICRDWEQSADTFAGIAERIVKIRTAPVLSQKGGTLEPLIKITNLNLASGIGSGKQWFNWIHLEDLVNIYTEAVENPNINGAYNAVADEIPTNEDFMRALAKAKNKFFIPVKIPQFLLKTVLGEMSEIILEGTRASNNKIKSQGFKFKFPDLNSAFQDLL